ncbi:CHAT domain-containing protein [Streptomyces sp. NPDC047525]|uniref:CHAT domain-containing protein n=1 Tax=Streptomyces sp. NPDC047525 TaxID=3155264 RepID=UPI0034006A05
MTKATLTLLNEHEGEYEDDMHFLRSRGRHVRGPLGSHPLLRHTVSVLHRWVARYDENCSRDELVLLGRCLYALAFGERSAAQEGGQEDKSAPLLDAFEETYADHRTRYRDQPLRLRLVITPEAGRCELGRYPWEFLYKPEGTRGFFVAGERTELVLTRYVPPVVVSDADQSREDDDKLRILVVLSLAQSPELGTVSADSLVKDIIALRSDSIEVEPLRSPTRGELREAVSAQHPHIIHFVGHGDSEKGIALRKDAAQIRDDELQAEAEALRSRGERVARVDPTDWVDRETISGILRGGEGGGRRKLGRLVFLHACTGATAEESEISLKEYESVATLLAGSPGIAGVIAMQYPISNCDAQMFARHFYQELRNGQFIDQAVGSARRLLGHADQRRRAAWADRGFATPVVYLSDDDPLCQALPQRLSNPSAICPNEVCQAPLDLEKGVCPSCLKVFMSCRKPGGCPGLVVAELGAHCNNCGYRLARPSSPPTGRRAQATRPDGGSGHGRHAPPPLRGTRPEDTGEAPPADTWE